MINDLEEVNQFMRDNLCKALVVGDTIDNFDPESYKEIEKPVFTPVISHTKEQINDLIENIR